MKSLLLLLIAGTLSLSANASNWVLVAYTDKDTYTDADAVEVYVDTDSISKEGEYRTAFYKNKYLEYQTDIMNRAFNASIIFVKYDCSNNYKKFKTLSFLDSKDNKVVDYGDIESISDWEILYPDSIGEYTANFVCSY